MSKIDIIKEQDFRQVDELWSNKFEMRAIIRQEERDIGDTKSTLKIFNRVTVYNMDNKEFCILPMNIAKMFSNKAIRTYKEGREGVAEGKIIEVSGRVHVTVLGELMVIR